jgi:hypothetical protein
MASKKQSSKPTKNNIITTQAEIETRDPIIASNVPVDLPETPETAPDLPRYQNGCPECGEHSLVTEQIHSWRVCHCRECEWRGEMED